MKSYAVDSKPLILIKKAIDIFSQGEWFHHNMMIFCQLKGFQGHKRWNRLQSKEDREIKIKVENYVVDMFGDSIEPSWDFTIPAPKTYHDYLEKYLEWEIYVYKEINSIANELTVNNYICESNLVGECLDGVRKEIEKVRRWLQEYENVSGDMSYIMLKDKELHDKIKGIEE